MPRLPPSLIRRAHSISPHLATLLPACRDLGSARNELRWIREYVADVVSSHNSHNSTASNASVDHSRALRQLNQLRENALLSRLCRRRGSGVPLQYILGTQPFGDLEIRCRKGVLIPRPETEAWVSRLAEVVRGEGGHGFNEGHVRLNILDLCTGSGCIALLLYSLLRRSFSGLDVRAVDVETRAVALARENLACNSRQGFLAGAGQAVEFEEADIFSAEWLSSLLRQGGNANGIGTGDESPAIDILVSNPPYISARGFNRDTERSVRKYEPKLALVPSISSTSFPDCRPEDVFYARLLEVYEVLRPRFAVFEVGDLEQALRVVQMTRSKCNGAKIEVWRDWPDMQPCDDEADFVEVDGVGVPVRGSGNGRAVFIRRTV
ncbi:S-adenosyl-L-methionine-dependent methyltransferase [Hypoxylon sp. FL0890]|nr:S-adenosyl-L-methionine-dependent methyltransferase [Hypoxylon sp. FL0890]